MTYPIGLLTNVLVSVLLWLAALLLGRAAGRMWRRGRVFGTLACALAQVALMAGLLVLPNSPNPVTVLLSATGLVVFLASALLGHRRSRKSTTSG